MTAVCDCQAGAPAVAVTNLARFPTIFDGNDPLRTYGAGVLRGVTLPILPGIPGLPQADYVVVSETKAPHHTLATAQELPDLPYFGVVGTLGSGDPIDLYRVTLGSGAARLNFGLESDQSALTVPMQLQVFDGSGQHPR